MFSLFYFSLISSDLRNILKMLFNLKYVISVGFVVSRQCLLKFSTSLFPLCPWSVLPSLHVLFPLCLPVLLVFVCFAASSTFVFSLKNIFYQIIYSIILLKCVNICIKVFIVKFRVLKQGGQFCFRFLFQVGYILSCMPALTTVTHQCFNI